MSAHIEIQATVNARTVEQAYRRATKYQHSFNDSTNVRARCEKGCAPRALEIPSC